MKQTDIRDDGEDQRSIHQHIAVMKQESQKMRPKVDIICQHLQKIQKYRTNYILQHTTEEVPGEFPSLTIPVVVGYFLTLKQLVGFPNGKKCISETIYCI